MSKKLEQFMRKWIKILRLQDYEVILVIVPGDSVNETGAIGLCDREHHNNRAIISIAEKQENHEATIVHELLHLRFSELTGVVYTLMGLVGHESRAIAETMRSSAEERLTTIMEDVLIGLDRKEQ